jgi:HEAT repeat protein
MSSAFTYACAVVWCRTGEKDAGWELIRALNDRECEVREIASSALAEAGPRSLSLIEAALTLKAITPEQAAPCLFTILANLPPDVLTPDN